MTDNGEVFHILRRRGVDGAQPAEAAPQEREVVTLSEAAERRAQELRASYPQSRSAVMPLLYIAQEELGFIDQRAVQWVAARLALPPVQVWEVATFYTMYYKRPVGKYHIQVCRTLPCALRGARWLSDFIQQRIGVKVGEVSPDGMWSFEEVECLGSCGTAPMCQINDLYFENLSPEKVTQLLERIEREQPDLRLSTVRDTLGAGLSGCPLSEIER